MGGASGGYQEVGMLVHRDGLAGVDDRRGVELDDDRGALQPGARPEHAAVEDRRVDIAAGFLEIDAVGAVRLDPGSRRRIGGADMEPIPVTRPLTNSIVFFGLQ
jgi:hypothetical protein